jgi:peptidoglycan DL-endopeptidase CwlO
MKKLTATLALSFLLAALMTAAGTPAPALASPNTSQELARLNQQLSNDQAKLDELNNSMEIAQADAENLGRKLAEDRQRESDLQLHISALARTEYERPALTLSTLLEATSLDQLLAGIAQAQLVAGKQRRLGTQATELRRQDQQTRERQAENVARIKQARDDAAKVATSTLALRDKASDAAVQARADAVAAQARATQAAAPKPPPSAPAVTPPPAALPPANAPPPPGAIVDPPRGNHFAYGYCTWYVANRRNVPWSGNAIAWWANARPYGYAEGQTPVVGAIMVTRESGYGHVAYVESVNGDGSWTVSEMNFVRWNVISQRTIHPGKVPLSGFIYGHV